MRGCKEEPLIVEVHDRTAIPDPPEFPLPDDQESATAASNGKGKAKDDGYVCGIARMPLHDLLKGRTLVKFRVPLLPFSTIRGAASLDWTTRPGNYCHAGSEVKVVIRLAVPLQQTSGYQPQERVFSRAVFVMDYRDSGLFHALEDTIRKHNAWKLGYASLTPPSAQLKQDSLSHNGGGGAHGQVRPMSGKGHKSVGGVIQGEEGELMPAFSDAFADEALGIVEDNDLDQEDKVFGGGNPLGEMRNSSIHHLTSNGGHNVSSAALRLPSIFYRPQVNSFQAAGFTHEKMRQRSAHRSSGPSVAINPQFYSHGGALVGNNPEADGANKSMTTNDTRKMARFRSQKGLA